MVQLTDALIQRLDREAAKRSVSRSAVLREAVEQYFADEDDLIQAYVEGYQRIPAGTVDEWGDLDAQADAAAAETAKRLDHEEREAGFEPW